MNDPNAITPSPQTRQKYVHGPACSEQPSAQPSPEATTTTATIARGPPRHDNSGNDKALEGKPELRSCLSISMSETRDNELFGEEYSYV